MVSLLNTKEFVFVYGSLLKGLHNQHYLSKATLVESNAFTWKRFAMVSLGWFPACLEAPYKPKTPYEIARSNSLFRQVKGELYEVDKKTLRRLDSLEGHPDFYERKLVKIKTTTGSCTAWMYLAPPDLYVLHQYPLVKTNKLRMFDWKLHTLKEDKRAVKAWQEKV